MLDSFLYFFPLNLTLPFCLVIPQFLVYFLVKTLNKTINGISISIGIMMALNLWRCSIKRGKTIPEVTWIIAAAWNLHQYLQIAGKIKWNFHFCLRTKREEQILFIFLSCNLHFLWLLFLWFLCIHSWSPWKINTRCRMLFLYSSIAHCKMFCWLTKMRYNIGCYCATKPMLSFSEKLHPLQPLQKLQK